MRLTGRIYLFPSKESSWLQVYNVSLKPNLCLAKYSEFRENMRANTTELLLCRDSFSHQ